MTDRVIVLSGPVGAGKSSLAKALQERFACNVIKTHELISKLKNVGLERKPLQLAGEELDRDTDGAWLGNQVAVEARDLSEDCVLVIDSVRLKSQIKGLRQVFGEIVTHVHVTAPEKVLAVRYGARVSLLKELPSYEEVRSDPTEAQVDTLGDSCDIRIDTEQNSAEDVVVRVASRLGLFGRGQERLVDVIIGGQYGSEGKGQVAAYLAPEYELLLRVGGPNAGHTVYEEPDPYTFHSLPSGSRVTDKTTLVIGPGAVLNVGVLLEEIAECNVEYKRLFIDPSAMIVADDDMKRETESLKGSIGSTAQGVGFATARKVLRGAFPGGPDVKFAKDIPELKHYIRPTNEVLSEAYRYHRRVMLEGTQGTGLSLHHGEYPHVTSRDTTVSGCLSESGIPPLRVRRVIMVCRTYPIRVQSPAESTSGPMGVETTWAEVAKRSGIPAEELEKNEITSTTKRKRRVAEFSWKRLRDATTLNAPTDIALTFADYLSIKNRDARRFDQLTTDSILFIEEIERVARAPVSLIATRFHYRAIIDRRHW